MSKAAISPWRLLYNIVSYALLVALAVAILFPVLWMLMTSLKEQWEIFAGPFALPSSFNLSNYIKAWTIADFGRYFMNSIIITGGSIAGALVFASMAGYAFARLRFTGSNALFLFFLLGLMIAPQVVMIPIYHWLSFLGLIDTYIGVIFTYFSWTPFGILMLRTFFRGVPQDLEDAARIDGCTDFQIFWRVMLPLVTPALATSGIFLFVWIWNDFIFPLILLQSMDRSTLPLGIMGMQGQFEIDWGLQTAGLSIATLPPIIFYYLFQRQFVRGLTAGAVKG